ncbi:salicylate synthetase [Amycolatopsis sacchari]|uniref:Salicylate synthetase n=1 Tax=Amycolatopsis sacchari TaxID=115433 RepID=A0A1I3P4L2_9PSEU|nr:salicylate synthase [Amycolatopsis sacchari]SFJ16495.1 salicylate synthetase [Amycolatopsis sacchari]
MNELRAVAALARAGFEDYVVYERDGAWTFAGGALATITLDATHVRVRGIVESETEWSGSPGAALRRALESLPVPGWRAYGFVHFGFSKLLSGLRLRGAAAPAGDLVRLIVPRTEVRLGADGVSVSGEEQARVREILREPFTGTEPRPRPIDVRADGAGYRDRVALAVKEIRQGQYQKVILSRTVRIPYEADLVATYELGRAANTPARSFLLRLGGAEAAGFSPEVVVTVTPEGEVTTQPLAGTRAFGRGSEQDAAARAELESNPKEIFEHAVSVRTAQEELRRVCTPESVRVGDFMGIKERGSVQHLASLVNGRLAEGRTAWDALEALFPAVTASGIPKLESLDAIARLDEARGLYSGAVLTASDDGSLDAALVLRAVYQEDGAAWLRAGAGIVADSTPEREFEETCEKLTSVAPYVVPA